MLFERKVSKLLKEKSAKFDGRSMKKCSKYYEEMSRIWGAWVMLIAITAFGMVSCNNDELPKQGMTPTYIYST